MNVRQALIDSGLFAEVDRYEVVATVRVGETGTVTFRLMFDSAGHPVAAKADVAGLTEPRADYHAISEMVTQERNRILGAIRATLETI